MMKKIFMLLFILLFPVVIYGVENVNYTINDYIVDATIDISGNILVKEVIEVKGSYNGYIRDLVYKNSILNEFDGSVDSFMGSSIYNASNINLYKVGKIEYDKSELDYNIFNEEVIEFSECTDNTNCYQKSNINDGISIKMYNETYTGSTYFYIEYLLGNAVVLHNDVGEVYYNFIGENFDDEIDKYQLRLLLPIETTEQIRVWAHGPLNGEIKFIAEEKDGVNTYYGGYLYIDNLSRNTPVDMRMTFPLSEIMVEHPFLKKSNTDGLDKILEVENLRADTANKEREKAKLLVIVGYIVSIIFFILIIVISIYIYIKYDKEYIPNFKGEYYRDFIDDYDVTSVEYLFNKKITDRSFSTSILNMIYKKNIKYEKIDKKNYKFIKVNEDNLNSSELIIMDMLFNKCGKNNEVTLKDIKKYASSISGINSEFLNQYNNWLNTTTTSAVNENFFESKSKLILFFILILLSSIIIIFLQSKIGLYTLTFITILLVIMFSIYLLVLNKRTRRGVEDYSKWKSFKKFLKDFGRFNEKELPEITLWERYLVYASIFGIADEVSKTMDIKFKEINNIDTSRDILLDYVLYNELNRSINRCINTSVNTATSKVNEAKAREISNTTSSSGSGFGGGFSSGGGFGGGGGGGRGF